MGKAGVRFEVIRDSRHENELSISLLCEIAGVSRSGYYSWLKAEGARQAREEKDRADLTLVLGAYRICGYQKGARSSYMRLLHSDQGCHYTSCQSIQIVRDAQLRQSMSRKGGPR